MARQNPSGPHGLGTSSHPVPKSPNPQVTMNGVKKKKKSHKSKNKDRLSAPEPSSAVECSAPQDEEQSRPSKRKHDSEPERKKKKKKKKKHHAPEVDMNDVSMNALEDGQGSHTSPQREHPPLDQSNKPSPNGVSLTALASQPGTPDYETTGEINSKGRPKKQRGSRIGGKNNLKVGFFTPDEVGKLEKFKVDFCNIHRLAGAQFDEMVQHSEREGGEFPCSPSVTSKSEFWADIYRVLPDRDRRSVYRFMRRHFQVTTQKPHEWTDEQDEELIALHAEHGPKWTFIARITGRSDDDVTQRWKNRLEHRGTMNRGAWSRDELRAFLGALQKVWEGYRVILHEGAGNDMYEMDEKLVGWGVVSDTMKNVRSRQQCADKWRKVRKSVMAARAAGDPNAVFDPEAAKKQFTDSNASNKSHEYVVEEVDDDDDYDESMVVSSTPARPLKHGFADEQKMMALLERAAKETRTENASSPRPKHETNAGLDFDINDQSQVPDSNAAAISSTPLSASSAQKRDSIRIAQIKEKIKEANQSTTPKKRKRSEAEQPTEPESEPVGTSPSAERQSKKERKKEKKRQKKERKERAAREQAEAAEIMPKQAAEGEKRSKKPKKSLDAADAIAAAAPDKKKKKSHKSDADPNDTAVEEQPEPVESSKKKRKKEKRKKEKKQRAAREERSDDDSDMQDVKLEEPDSD